MTARGLMLLLACAPALPAAAQECPVSGKGFVHFSTPFLDRGRPSTAIRHGDYSAEAPGLVYATDPAGGEPVQVQLERLSGDGTALDGRYVRVSSNRLDMPGTAAPGRDGAADFLFEPSDWETEDCVERIADCSRFDAVNVYHHVDRMATEFWRDRMGIDPVFQADVVTHISGEGGFADAPRNLIMLSVGWTFMRNAAKEDEIIYHEYTHLLAASLGFDIDINSPEEARALSEGYADYFAASFTDDARIGEWIVTCPSRQGCPGPPNDPDIRTLDTDPAVWNWQGGNPSSSLKYGVCTRYHNGDGKCKTSWNNFTPRYTWAIIWASLLWDLRTDLGADMTDRIALEAMRGSDGQTESIERAAGRLVEADGLLFNAAHREQITAAVHARGIDVLTSRGQTPERVAFEVGVHPHPASGAGTVSLRLSEAGPVRVRVFDALGREMDHLLSGVVPAGTTRLTWDTSSLAPGLYLLSVEGEAGRRLTRPVVVTR